YRDPRRVDLEKRDSQLNDYWQQNPDCSRSGINKTRRDFTLMGTEITQWLRDNKKTKNLNKVLTSVKARGASNVFQAISTYLINDDTPTNLGRGSKTLVKGVVDLLMEIRENAVDMTQDFAAAQAAKKDKKRGPRA
ncbi:MAG: hypothetical protein HYR96_14080, partial [Deltaproteobacteria bacterium]|nr:hypothetical protein [Deltaproteobacteria bacterium]